MNFWEFLNKQNEHVFYFLDKNADGIGLLIGVILAGVLFYYVLKLMIQNT